MGNEETDSPPRRTRTQTFLARRRKRALRNTLFVWVVVAVAVALCVTNRQELVEGIRDLVASDTRAKSDTKPAREEASETPQSSETVEDPEKELQRPEGEVRKGKRPRSGPDTPSDLTPEPKKREADGSADTTERPDGESHETEGSDDRRGDSMRSRRTFPPLDPETQALFDKAAAFRSDRDPGKLVEVLGELEQRRPEDPRVHFRLGEVYGSAGKRHSFALARSAFQRYLDLTKDEGNDDRILERRGTAEQYLVLLSKKHRLFLVTPTTLIASMTSEHEAEIATRQRTISKAAFDIELCEEFIKGIRNSGVDYGGPEIRHKNLQIGELHSKIQSEKLRNWLLFAELVRLRRAALGEEMAELAVRDPDRMRMDGIYGGRASGRKRLVGTSAGAARAIDLGLKWLRDHQDFDGKWDCDGFMRHDTDGLSCDGAGNPVHDVGCTGLALLAFLGDGSTMRSGPYKGSVRKAVSWLLSQQGFDGLFGTSASEDFVYGHAIATYAMCEAYGLSNETAIKNTAQKAINYLESHRNPKSCWGYRPRDNSDSSVTGWCVMAYKSGKHFGLRVNASALKLAVRFLDEVTDPASGRCGYTKRGERSSRRADGHATHFPIQKSEALTGVGLLCRFFLGQDPKKVPVMKLAADSIMASPPIGDDPGAIDYYYWYYATHALYQMGGSYWTRWSKSLTRAVVQRQCDEGNYKGSWDPAGVWGEDGGRVYSTAILVLTLEANYRYGRLGTR